MLNSSSPPKTAFVLLAVAFTVGAIQLQSQAVSPAPARPGYLSTLDPKDLLLILPPPPSPGDGRDSDDRAIFLATRALQGSPRWTLAQSDARVSPTDLMLDFACDLGFRPTPETAPHLALLLARITQDENAATGIPKVHYQRKRPFVIEDGPVCLPGKEELTTSPDYPSSHAALGWTTGLILAELRPDRACRIMARGRQYGESRVFCGLHNASSVEAGRLVGAAVAAMLHGSESFRQDLELARTEVKLLSQKGSVDETVCLTQARVLAPSPKSPAHVTR